MATMKRSYDLIGLTPQQQQQQQQQQLQPITKIDDSNHDLLSSHGESPTDGIGGPTCRKVPRATHCSSTDSESPTNSSTISSMAGLQTPCSIKQQPNDSSLFMSTSQQQQQQQIQQQQSNPTGFVSPSPTGNSSLVPRPGQNS